MVVSPHVIISGIRTGAAGRPERREPVQGPELLRECPTAMQPERVPGPGREPGPEQPHPDPTERRVPVREPEQQPGPVLRQERGREQEPERLPGGTEQPGLRPAVRAG